MTNADTRDLEAIAYLVHRIRPEWAPAGIAAVLRRLSIEELPAIAHAAITAAATRPDQNTPHIIGASGPHWTNCIGQTPPSPGSRPWTGPNHNTPPAPPATITTHRHTLGHHKDTPHPNCGLCPTTHNNTRNQP